MTGRRSLRRRINEDMTDVTFGGDQVTDEMIDAAKEAEAELRSRQIQMVDIFDILPDFEQPRRVLPSEVRAGWDRSHESISKVLRLWNLGTASENKGRTPFILNNLIFGDALDNWDDEHPGVLSRSLLSLCALAADIADQGLTEPIKLAAEDTTRIVDGERRWWAHHLLLLVTGDEEWRQIKAQVVPRSVWRQATANTQREGLNAISMARQIALLIMDAHAAQGAIFKTFDEMVSDQDASDREFYAQVADGTEWPIPRGEGSKFLVATGLKSTVQLRQYRALLRVPDDIWMEADDEDWAEGKVRAYIQEERKPSPPQPTITAEDGLYEVPGDVYAENAAKEATWPEPFQNQDGDTQHSFDQPVRETVYRDENGEFAVETVPGDQDALEYHLALELKTELTKGLLTLKGINSIRSLDMLPLANKEYLFNLLEEVEEHLDDLIEQVSEAWNFDPPQA